MVGTSGLDDLAPVKVARPTPRLREEVDFDLRGDLFDALAVELRLFGTRIVMIAGADADGQLAELVYTDRGHSDDELAVAFVRCLRHLDASIADAVVYCDESVQPTVLALEFGRIVERFEAARSFARDAFGVHLVDWVACERERFRSSHALADPGRDRWRRR